MTSQQKSTARPDMRAMLRQKADQTADPQLDSNPLVKKNAMGHYLCVLCSVQIKNHTSWVTHAAKTSHKQALTTYIEAKKGVASSTSSSKLQTIDSKKGTFNTQTQSNKVSSNTLGSLVSYGDDDENDDDMEASNRNSQPLQVSQSSEANPQIAPSTTNDTKSNAHKESEKKADGALPKGFFDDQKTDYKMRGEKLPEEEFEDDWKEFNKQVSSDLQLLEIIQNEEDLIDHERREYFLDIEQREHETKLDEIKEKTSDLKKRLELLRRNQQKHKKDETITKDDALSEAVLLDWRAKKLKTTQ